jgi:hypothetical protein
MTGKLLAGIAAGIVMMLLGCAGALGAFLEGGGGDDTTTSGCTVTLDLSAPPSADATPTPIASGRRWPAIGQWNPAQVADAAIIVAAGAALGVPIRGWVIAVATAMQESSLHNYGNLGANNDHDSLGLFQQRPSQGWGTPAQIMDPVHASTSFYQHLLQVNRWQTLPLTVAAQAVQRSAFPDAYAKWEKPADDLVAAVTGLGGILVGCGSDISGDGWTQPVTGPITSRFRIPDRPAHDGVDIGVPQGAPIHAASAGTVTAVGCTAHTASGTAVSCDIDGDRGLVGLGWYVTIAHADAITTSYGHQLETPASRRR